MSGCEIPDHSQRQQALDPRCSFAVAAPAGSGKTGLLVQRTLKLLATVDNPEEILCLTFTRKAAAEMQQRIHRALESASATEPEDSFEKQTWQLAREVLARDTHNNWQLLRAPGRLRITTIDSLCRTLALQLGPESLLAENTETLDKPLNLYAQATGEVVQHYLEDASTIGDAVRTLLIHQQNDLNKMVDLLVSLLQKRDQWLMPILNARNSRQTLECFLQEVIASTLQKATEQLSGLSDELILLADYAANNLQRNMQGDPSEEYLTKNPLLNCVGLSALPKFSEDNMQACLEQWQGLVQLLLTNDDTWRKIRGVNIKLGFPSKKDDPALGDLRKQQLADLLEHCQQQPGLLETLIDIRFLPSPTYPDNQWQVLDALTRLLPVLAAHLQSVFREQSQCDYSEVTLAALQALGSDEDPTDLALRLDYKIRHILIDEFQDTSTIQYQLLRRLTRGWMPDDGRTLFVVGDGMQSLYGFRSANVGLFIEARTAPLGDIQMRPLDLASNFRSQARIIDWVNAVFARCFPPQDNLNRGAVKYTPAASVKAALEQPAVTVDGIVDATEPYSCEAEKLVELVSDAKSRDPDGTIVILVRDRGQLGHLLPALRSAGFSWQAQDVEPLAGQMAVIDLLSLTRAFVEPADRISWLAILRAPWCGLDLKDLYQLTNQAITDNPAPHFRQYPLILQQLLHHEKIENLSESGRKILDRVAPLLVSVWQQRFRKTLRDSIEGLWRDLGGDITASHFGQLTSCHAYLNLLEQHQQAGTIRNWPQFEQALASLYAEPDSSGDPKLQVMTIHKAKGLEFDTVIIPGLNRKPAGGGNPLMLWREGLSENGEAQLIISPKEPDSDESDAIFQHLKHEQSLKEKQETLRVMYVGATRAIKWLHLIFSADTRTSSNNTGLKVTSGSLLESIWPYAEDPVNEVLAGNPNDVIRLHNTLDVSEEEDDGQPPMIKTLTRLKPDFQLSMAEKVSIFSSEQTTRHAESKILEEPATESDSAIIGTVLHRILRQITLDGVGRWLENDWQRRSEFWQLQLQQSGCADTNKGIEQLLLAINNVLQNQDNHWLFDNTLPQSYCEYPLGYKDSEDRIRQAIIDRTFCKTNAQGQLERWIVDYKSASPVTGETLEQFLAVQAKRYQSQLDFYASLLKPLSSEPLRTALYFPLVGHFHPLSG